ncbi:hypothetical protein [Ensifer canadensis]
MSNRLVFSLLFVSMSILLVWAFRPATTMFTGSSQTNQSDTQNSMIEPIAAGSADPSGRPLRMMQPSSGTKPARDKLAFQMRRPT